MSTVTETYVIYINKTAPDWPISATNRLNSWISSNKIISNTKTEIDSDNPSKKKYRITRQYRSAEDYQNFIKESEEDSSLEKYLNENGYSITKL